MFSRNSDCYWVQMNFDVPCEEIYKEYYSIKDNLVIHRPEDGHKDWCAMTLYGVSSSSTNSHWEYGLKQKKKITDIGSKCPKTLEWVMSLPYARIDDVRYLVIKPKGYIAEHVDVEECNWLEPLNVSITYPVGSKFLMKNELVPYKPGVSMVLNIHYPHSVVNNSDEERLHLVVHGKKKKEFWNYVKQFKQP